MSTWQSWLTAPLDGDTRAAALEARAQSPQPQLRRNVLPSSPSSPDDEADEDFELPLPADTPDTRVRFAQPTESTQPEQVATPTQAPDTGFQSSALADLLARDNQPADEPPTPSVPDMPSRTFDTDMPSRALGADMPSRTFDEDMPSRTFGEDVEPATLSSAPRSTPTSSALLLRPAESMQQRFLAQQVGLAIDAIKALPNLRFVQYDSDGTPQGVLAEYANLYDYYVQHYSLPTALSTLALIEEENEKADSADAKRLLAVQLLQAVDMLLQRLAMDRERNCTLWARLFGGDADYNEDAANLTTGALSTSRNYLCTGSAQSLGELQPESCKLEFAQQ